MISMCFWCFRFHLFFGTLDLVTFVASERLHGIFEAQLLPPDCHGGVVHLDGKYRTAEVVEYHNDCTLSGAPGTEVEVFGKIHFLQNAKLQGSITFHGVKGLPKHRCVDVEGSLEFVEPNVEFINCGSEETEDGGGFYVEHEVILREGRVVARGCTARWGGCGFIGEGLKVTGGSMLFQDCKAVEDGGGLFLKQGNYQQSGTSNVTFVNCTAFGFGGGMCLEKNHFTQHAGYLSFQKCYARAHGGGVYVNGSFHQMTGVLEGMDCATLKDFGAGGLISAVEIFIHGQISANGCEAHDGGCISGPPDVTVNITGGFKVQNCHAVLSGGAISASHVTLGGEISITNCSAGNGGAIHSSGTVLFENATAYFQDTFATSGSGGAIRAGTVRQKGGEIHVKNSFSTTGGAICALYFYQTGFASFTSCASVVGGALYVLNYDISGASTFENCSASGPGGAIYATALVRQRSGSISFDQCQSKDIGGAVFASYLTQRGHLQFSNCWARRSGGAIAIQTTIRSRKDVEDWFPGLLGVLANPQDQMRLSQTGRVVLDGSCEFQNCLAGMGGAVSVSKSFLLKQNGSAIFEDCRGEGSAGALVGDKIVVLGNATFRNISMGVIQSTGSVQLVSPVMQKTSGSGVPQITAMKEIQISDVFFENTSSVWFSAPQIHVKNVRCDNGLQSFMDSVQVGCKTCEENKVQFSGGPVLNENGTLKKCVPAPGGTAKIGLDHLKLKMGYMTEMENITRSFRCPNRMACIGGTISTHGWGEMCAPGYEGRGCYDCASSYAVSDSNSFVCLKCASSKWQQMFQMAHFFLQDLVLFGLSAMGISSGTSKDSTILMNHFMSFVAAAGPILEVVRETPTFKQTGKTVDNYVEGFSSMMEVGETSSGGMSGSCILSYLKLPQEWWSRTFVILFMPMFAIATLTLARGWRMAGVVGMNCFLPKACLCFARYLACFRMEPQDEGGQLFCLADIYTSFSYLTLTAIISSIAFAGPAIWSMLLRDDENKNAAFFLYLTGPYKEQFRSWEVTRLVRKAALAIISAALPISLHPATQIMCISFILLTALVLETQMQPYKDQFWNMEEKILLTLSLALVSVTSCYMANENNWTSNYQSQCVLLYTIFTLCIVPSNVMIYLIIRQLLRERGICVEN